MSQAFLLHRAKQGDSQAIAKLLTQSLLFRKVEIRDSSLEENCLHLKIQARKVVNQHKIMPFIQEELGSLNLDDIHKLEVSAFVGDAEEAAWTVTVDLKQKQQNLTDISNIVATKNDESEGEEVSVELRAKRGDSNAVLELLNQELEPKKLTTQIRFHKGYLQVLIEPESVIDREDAVQLIRQKILDTKLPLIKKVTVYGKEIEDAVPLWHQDFDLTKTESSVKSSPAKSEETLTSSPPPKTEHSVTEEETPKSEPLHLEKKSAPVKDSKNGNFLPIFIAISLGLGILVGGVGSYIIFKPQVTTVTPSEGTDNSSPESPAKLDDNNQTNSETP